MVNDKIDVHVRRLESSDDRSSFHCGDIELDRFFQRYASQNQFRHHIGTTYVAMASDQVVGFVTVSTGEMTAEKISKIAQKRLPAYPIPILRTARLAVDIRFQGLGIGKLLLRAMLELAVTLRDQVGCAGVVVDAKQDSIEFYTCLGFTALDVVTGVLKDRPEPVAMFLPINLIAKL